MVTGRETWSQSGTAVKNLKVSHWGQGGCLQEEEEATGSQRRRPHAAKAKTLLAVKETKHIFSGVLIQLGDRGQARPAPVTKPESLQRAWWDGRGRPCYPELSRWASVQPGLRPPSLLRGAIKTSRAGAHLHNFS